MIFRAVRPTAAPLTLEVSPISSKGARYWHLLGNPIHISLQKVRGIVGGLISYKGNNYAKSTLNLMSSQGENCFPHCPHFPAKIADFGLKYFILKENAKKQHFRKYSVLFWKNLAPLINLSLAPTSVKIHQHQGLVISIARKHNPRVQECDACGVSPARPF